MTEETTESKLATELHKITFHHIVNKLIDEGEQDTSDLINIVLSAHMGSLARGMIQVANSCNPPNQKMLDYVNKFIEEMIIWVKDHVPKDKE